MGYSSDAELYRFRSQGVTGLSPAGRSRTVSTRFVE